MKGAMMGLKKKALGTLVLVCMLAVAGCATRDSLTYSNFNRVEKNAHTQTDVSGILGEPTYRLDNIWIYERPSDHLIVKVEFDESGRVQRKEWVDGKTGQWEDTND